jgi:hypothetical protein
MKNSIYSSPTDSDEDLIACTAAAAATFRQKPGIFEQKPHSLLCCCQFCIEVGGRMFEHLL